MEQFDYLAAAVLSGAFFAGMTPRFWKSVQSFWADRMAIDENRVVVNGRELAGMMIAGVVIGGVVIDHWGARHMVFGGSFGMTLGVALLAVSGTPGAGRFAVWIVGAAGGCLLNASVKLMPDTINLVDNGGTQSFAADLNFGFVFVGLGYLAVGPMTAGLIRKVTFRHGLLIFALLCSLPAIFMVWTPLADFPQERIGAFDLTEVLASPRLWIAAVFVFLFAPQVEAVRTWGRAYLTEVGYQKSSLVILTGLFWVAFLASRAATGFILDPRFEFWLLLPLVVGAAATLGNLFGGYEGTSSFGFVVLGVFYGPIFPTILGIVLRQESGRSTAFGIVYAMGALSTLLAGPLLRADDQPARPRIRTSMILLLLATAPILALAFIR